MEERKSIFTRESLDHMESPEKTDTYIRIAAPGIWILIAALLVTVAALFIWGLTGSIPESVTVGGVVDPARDGCVVCLVDADAYSREDLEDGEASISIPGSDPVSGTVTEISALPVSEDEVMDAVENEWMASRLAEADYSYVVTVLPEEDLSGLENQILQVSIITGEVKPVSFLVG